MAKSRGRHLADLLNTSGLVKKSKSALAGSDEVIDLNVLPTITNAKLENSSIGIAGHTVSLGSSATLAASDLSDINYTTTPTAGQILVWDNTNGYWEPGDKDTSDSIAEGSNNLYFTNARARAAISVSGNILSYNSTTGVLSADFEESPVFTGNVEIRKDDPTLTFFNNSGANTDPNGTIIFSEASGTPNFEINYNGANDRLEFRGRVDNTNHTDLVYFNRSSTTPLSVVGGAHFNGNVSTGGGVTVGDSSADVLRFVGILKHGSGDGTTIIDASRNMSNIASLAVSGTVDFNGNTSIAGYLNFDGGDQNGLLRIGGSNVIGKSNNWLYIDPNTSFSSGIYINNLVKVDGGKIGSYNEDLQLRTANTTALTLSNTDQTATFVGKVRITNDSADAVVIGSGNESITFGAWDSGQTDIAGLLAGSNFGSLITGGTNGHVVIGLRDNDVNDSFSVVSGAGDYMTGTTYDKLAFQVNTDGVTTIGNRLDVKSQGTILQKWFGGSTEMGRAVSVSGVQMAIGTLDSGILFNASSNAVYAWDVGNNQGSNNLLDLGIATRQWKDLYIGGTFYIDGVNFRIDEDDMSSNSATRVPTQQSVKAYVDAEVAGVVDSAPSALNTLNELAAALGDDANFATTTSTALGNRLRVDTASQGLTGTQQSNALTNLGITSTKAELNLLDGVTATTAEINYIDGVTSNIQTQLNAKQGTLSGSTNITTGTINSGVITATQLNINSGATNTTAVFSSSDDKAFIRIKDDDTDTYLISKDNKFSIGESSSDYDNFKIDITSGDINSNGYISAGETAGTGGGLVLASRYAGNDHIATISSMYSNGGWVLGYGAKAKNGASGFVSTFDNFSGARSYLRIQNSAIAIGYAAAQQTAVDSDITGLSEPFVFTPSSGALSITGQLTASTVNTGQGATEVHLMNQNVRTTDSPTFDELTVTDFVKASGNNLKLSAGGTHVINMDLNRHFYPQTHNSTDIGFSSTLAFKDAYFSGVGYYGKLIVTSTGTIGTNTPANGYLKVTDGTNTLALDPNEIYSDASIVVTTGGDFDLRNGSFSMGTNTIISAARNVSNIKQISAATNAASGAYTFALNNDVGQKDAFLIKHDYDRDIGIRLKNSVADFGIWMDGAGDDSLIFSPGTGTAPAVEIYQNKKVDFHGEVNVDVAGQNFKLNSDASERQTIQWTQAGTTKWYATLLANGNLRFEPNGSEIFEVYGDMQVGTGGTSGTASIRFNNDNERARITSNYDSGGGGRLGFWTDTAGGSLLQRMVIDNEGFVGIGQGFSAPTANLHIYRSTATSASANGRSFVKLDNYVGGDLQQQKTFIDFTFTDDNTNETPQVRIGAEVGQNGDANSQLKEGSGAFVVYTNNANTQSGDAGDSLAERFRVDYKGNVGIGTATPGVELDIRRHTNGYPLRIGSTQGQGRGLVIADVHSSPTKYNFFAGAQYNVDNTFEITPSTAVGGYTFTDTAFRIRYDGKVSIGPRDTNSHIYGLLQVNQEADNDESGIGILNSSGGRSMRLWTDSTTSYINSGDGGGGTLILNQGSGAVKVGAYLHVPSRIVHDGDNDTYHEFTANEQDFVAGGVTALHMDSSRLNINPNAANYDFRASGDTEANMIYLDASADRLGIGTNTPDAHMHIQKSSVSTTHYDAHATLIVQDTEGRIQVMAANTGDEGAGLLLSNENKHWAVAHRAADSSNNLEFGYYQSSANGQDMQNANTAFLAIETGGNIGINETNPDSRLHITGSTGGWDKHITIEHDSSDIGKILVDTDGMKFRNMSSGNGFYFRNSDNATAMEITSGGNIDINGTANVGGKFAVMSTAVHASYDFYNNGTSYFNGAVTIDDNTTHSQGYRQIGWNTTAKNLGHSDQDIFFAISDHDDDISIRRKFERGDGDSNFNKEDDADAPASGVFSVTGYQGITWGPYIPMDDNSEWIFETWVKHVSGSDNTGNFYAGNQWYNGSKTSLGNNSRYWGANGDVQDSDNTTWRFIRGTMRGSGIRAQSPTDTAKYGRWLALFNYNTTGNTTYFCGFKFYKAKQTVSSLRLRQSTSTAYNQDSAFQSTEAATSKLVVGHDQRIYGNGGATNTTPQFSFNDDTDTGLGRISTNAVGLIANGSRKFYVDSGAAYFQNLAGGIEVSAALKLNNYDISGVNSLTFNDPGPGEGIIFSSGNTKIYESPNDLTTNSAGNLQIVYSNTRRLTVDSSGIDVNGRIALNGAITSSGQSITVDPASGDASLVLAGAAGAQTLRLDQNSIRTTTSSDISIFTSGNSRQIFLDQSSGYVGINMGSSVPGSTLDVNGTGTFRTDGFALRISSAANGVGAKTVWSDNGTPPALNSGQRGFIEYYHGDTVSYGSGNTFNITSTESTLTVLADGKLMFKEGLYLKPGSGTGAGTQLITNSGSFITQASYYFGATDSSQLAKDGANIRYLGDGQHTFETYSGGWITRAEIKDDGLKVTGKTHMYKDGTANAQTIVGICGSTSLRPTLLFSESAGTGITNGMSLEYDGRGSGDTNYMAFNSVSGANVWKIYSGGDMQAKGNVTAYQSSGMSDIRLKKDIKPLEGSLQKVLNMQGVSFKWKRDDKEAIGFIAQDIEKLVPEIVNEVPDIGPDEDDGTRYKTLDYGSTTAILVEAIKEQQETIEEQKNLINRLEERLNKLEENNG